jgi:hypothetical protein
VTGVKSVGLATILLHGATEHFIHGSLQRAAYLANQFANMIFRSATFFAAIVTTGFVHAQLTGDATPTAAQLVNNVLLGGGGDCQ